MTQFSRNNRGNTKLLISAITSICAVSGCSSNTVFDDNTYRSIGSSAPRKSSITESLANESGMSAHISDQSINSQELMNSANSEKHQQPEHLVRYGHPGIIDKVVKTARIHCQPIITRIETEEHSYWGAHRGQLTQCTYRFPAHCGAHQFAVIDYADKRALAYLEHNSSNYVIDMLSGTPAAKPGLWDKDDRIGSKANNMGYMLESNYNTNYQMKEETPLHLGWVIQASYDDEAAHGKHYHQALTDIIECF